MAANSEAKGDVYNAFHNQTPVISNNNLTDAYVQAPNLKPPFGTDSFYNQPDSHHYSPNLAIKQPDRGNTATAAGRGAVLELARIHGLGGPGGRNHLRRDQLRLPLGGRVRPVLEG
jgi:hypothetical protein